MSDAQSEARHDFHTIQLETEVAEHITNPAQCILAYNGCIFKGGSVVYRRANL